MFGFTEPTKNTQVFMILVIETDWYSEKKVIFAPAK